MKFKDLLTKRNIALALLLIIVLILGLRSCGSENFMRKRFYSIGRDQTWYPYQLVGKNRNLTAFTNDLMAVIAKESKLHFTFVETNASGLIEGLDHEHYDAILSSMRPHFSNQRNYLFSEPFFLLGPVLIVPQQSPATSLQDLQNKNVGISNISLLNTNRMQELGAHAHGIQWVIYDNMAKALDMLVNNRLSGVIMNSVPAYTMTENFYKGRVKIASSPLTDEGLRLVTLHGEESEALLEDFNEALKLIKENGTYAQLLAKWNLIDPVQPAAAATEVP